MYGTQVTSMFWGEINYATPARQVARRMWLVNMIMYIFWYSCNNFMTAWFSLELVEITLGQLRSLLELLK